MAYSAGYKSLGTIEFLVNGTDGEPHFAFIEANPRLQVEHTVTEEVTGYDLVRIQLEIAGGATLASLGLGKPGLRSRRGMQRRHPDAGQPVETANSRRPRRSP